MMTPELTLATANYRIAKGFGSPTFGRGIAFRSSLRTALSDFLLLAIRDGKASPMVVIARNNFQVAANLLYEPEDELHPEALALGNLKSSGQSWPVVQH